MHTSSKQDKESLSQFHFLRPPGLWSSSYLPHSAVRIARGRVTTATQRMWVSFYEILARSGVSRVGSCGSEVAKLRFFLFLT